MIRYTLLCAGEHGFDSWFRDSAAYEQLATAREIACPTCGSTTVRKALMTPSVVTSRSKRTAGTAPAAVEPALATAPQPAPAADPHAVALLDERARQLRAMMREVHRRVTATADNVGRAFATEARAMHEGEAPARSIYGEASRDEVAELLEDGIPLLPMPVLPDDHH